MLNKRLELKLRGNKTIYCNSYCLSLTSPKIVVLPIPANVKPVAASSHELTNECYQTFENSMFASVYKLTETKAH